jgi:hypothetical protein
MSPMHGARSAAPPPYKGLVVDTRQPGHGRGSGRVTTEEVEVVLGAAAGVVQRLPVLVAVRPSAPQWAVYGRARATKCSDPTLSAPAIANDCKLMSSILGSSARRKQREE